MSPVAPFILVTRKIDEENKNHNDHWYASYKRRVLQKQTNHPQRAEYQ